MKRSDGKRDATRSQVQEYANKKSKFGNHFMLSTCELGIFCTPTWFLYSQIHSMCSLKNRTTERKPQSKYGSQVSFSLSKSAP
jgi:hypothetical protein